jgi:hypothetical protein
MADDDVPAALVKLATGQQLTADEKTSLAPLVDGVMAGLEDADLLRKRSVFDLDMRLVNSMAGVWSILARWDVSRLGTRRLGDALKVLPPEHVEWVRGILAWGGWIAPEEVES